MNDNKSDMKTDFKQDPDQKPNILANLRQTIGFSGGMSGMPDKNDQQNNMGQSHNNGEQVSIILNLCVWAHYPTTTTLHVAIPDFIF